MRKRAVLLTLIITLVGLLSVQAPAGLAQSLPEQRHDGSSVSVMSSAVGYVGRIWGSIVAWLTADAPTGDGRTTHGGVIHVRTADHAFTIEGPATDKP